MRWLVWLRRHDRNLAALRRAGRAAIVMPLGLYVGLHVLDNQLTGLFAAFGAFAMLLLSDFTGPMTQRLQAQVALGVAGLALVCLGTLASAHAWLAALGMVCVGLPILFAGVVSSILASATPALLLAYILPACVPGPASAIPARAAGWGLAGVLSVVAVGLLWPTPTSDPLREPAVRGMRLMADRIRQEVAFAAGGPDAPTLQEREGAVEASDAAVAALRQTFLAAPYRPTGLSTTDRTVVRLVDELEWLAQVVRHGRPSSTVAHHVSPAVTAVKLAAADVLDGTAQVLHDPGAGSRQLEDRVDELGAAVELLEGDAATTLGGRIDGAGSDVRDTALTALDPTFRTQELAFATTQLAGNVVLTSAAWRRGGIDRVLGRQPVGVPSRWEAVVERGSAHLRLGSVWLHNSVRGALGLAVALFVADSAQVQHSFWIVLGTLSVLRSNALSTGQNAVRSVVGTTIGFALGGLLVSLIGADEIALWVLLPVSVLVAGFLPAAISFAAGQAAFTVLVMILFNLLQPAGWKVGLVRIEDVAIGCAVSLVVGALVWPHGAGAELRRAIAAAYRDSIRYLAAAVAEVTTRSEHGASPRDTTEPPSASALAAAASSRRLDDAYRTYLAERGAKPSSLANVTSLVNGVVGVRLVGEALVDLWRRDGTVDAAVPPPARRRLDEASHVLVGWYDALAGGLAGERTLPEALDGGSASDDLTSALRDELTSEDARRLDTAARVLWTYDYLDAIRRYQAGLITPAREVARIAAPQDTRHLHWLR